MSEVNMPRLSDTMQEGTIARWLKKPGDEVKKGDVLAEIETDKATMDLESYDAGVLEQILVQEGETAPIGQAVAIIGSGKDGGSGEAEQKQEQPAPPPTRTADRQKEAAPQAAETNVEDTQVAVGGPQPGRADSQGEQQERMESPESSDGSLIKASPLARRMAQEHNIDLRQIHGTGPGGRIVRDDIEDILEQQRATPAPQRQEPTEESPVPSSTQVTAA